MLFDALWKCSVIVLLSVSLGVIYSHLSLAWEINEMTLLLATLAH